MIGEEFGIIACLAIAILYLTIVVRVLIRLLDEEDKFLVLAAAGLVTQFGLQALINMAVNVQIAPSKGMTLPFISYGGSSMIALSIGFGLLLAFTRRNPYLHRSPYVGEVERAQTDDVAPLRPRRRRHRRPHDPGPCARRGADAARPSRRADHRRSRRAHPRPVRQASRSMSCPPGGSAAGRSAGCGRCSAILTGRAMALAALRDLPALGGDRLRRLSGACRRCSPRSATGIPTLIHEQNAVLGRVNRLMAGQGRRDRHRLSERRSGCRPRRADKVHLVGNPVRDEVLALRDQPFPALTEDGIFRLLVTGGSQGASILSEVVPEGLALLPEHFRRRLQVTQQCRAEDIEQVRARYAALGIPADLATYLPDLPERLAWAHLVIARAGASTIAELTAAGRPAILVPLPSATDDHQTANAREMAKAGGARMIRAARLHAGRARQADAEARPRARPRSPMPPRGRRAVGRPDAAQRPRRPRRADRPRSRRRPDFVRDERASRRCPRRCRA